MATNGKFSETRVKSLCRKAKSGMVSSVKSGSVKKNTTVVDRRRNGPVKQEK